MTSEARSPYEAAALLETWFREAGGFTYDEQPPAPIGGTPALVDFVNETKRGYCQHYAGAMALMLRLLGVPARVAVGFTSGEYDERRQGVGRQGHQRPRLGRGVVPGVRLDPVRPDPGPRRAGRHLRALLRASSAGDAAGIGFADRLEGISPPRRSRSASAANRPGLEGAALGGGSSGTFTVVRDRGPGIFALLALVIGGAIAAVVVLKAIRRSARFATRDPRALASACRRDIVGFLADQGVDLSPGATMPEIGAMLQRFYSIDATPFVRDVTVARFGPPARAGRRSAAPAATSASLRAALRARLGVRQPRPRRREPPLALDLGALGRPGRLPYGEEQA